MSTERPRGAGEWHDGVGHVSTVAFVTVAEVFKVCDVLMKRHVLPEASGYGKPAPVIVSVTDAPEGAPEIERVDNCAL